MADAKSLPVKDLLIDLYNFRTVPQKNEVEAIRAMISISPDYFWGLMESLLDDGYLPTENIIVLENSSGKIVKEGNRRVAALKIILKQIDGNQFDLPARIEERIEGLEESWLSENFSVPCAIYNEADAVLVDKIVTLTHGKGTKAGRNNWEAVARARHNRDKNGAPEVALDLLEKYLEHGANLTLEQKTLWSGRFNLSVLDEAIKRVSKRFAVSSSADLSRKYPNIKNRKSLEAIIHAVGIESLTFPVIRDSSDFALRFGVPPLPSASESDEKNGSSQDSPAVDNMAGHRNGEVENVEPSGSLSAVQEGTVKPKPDAAKPEPENGGGKSKVKTTAIDDERTVKKALRSLKVYGPNRSKLESIKKESLKLKLKDNPIAFCFLLRAMFEISAKAYCQDYEDQPNSPKLLKANGMERPLVEVLRDIVSHLTQNNADKQMLKVLHGALTEIQRKDGILSLTSMNQLVHNTSFMVSSSDIPVLFSNIFPLLDHMNK
ncbi:hypothetical protein HOP51_12320 [Halomonas sp. MCCC 1A11036]|uniref:ParB/Sulfiredoxin domain-containing protein n=1 Tax=Billgrantia zhangzhouensis TaxID=2733481 RepID=A0ABS9AGU7_9GAMM|nr:hypothetical protein [Halomonas zhangzhouensis]MCE8020888.1 hypothetical protein [Halomonas zhangzhouensis]